MPTMSRAASITEAIGDFLLTIPDGIFRVIQEFFSDGGDVLIKVKSTKQKDKDIAEAIDGALDDDFFSWDSATGTDKRELLLTYLFGDGETNLPHISVTPGDIFSNKIRL